jgi:hypothetical protein
VASAADTQFDHPDSAYRDSLPRSSEVMSVSQARSTNLYCAVCVPAFASCVLRIYAAVPVFETDVGLDSDSFVATFDTFLKVS